MTRKEKQDKKWNNLTTFNKDDLDYKQFVVRVGQDYLENQKRKNWIVKIFDWLFGPEDILGKNIIEEYGKHNIEKGL